MSDDRQDDRSAFDPPSSSTGRGENPEAEEDASTGAFTTPGEGSADEQAATPETFDALRGYSRDVLEVKEAIEQRLLQGTGTQGALHAAEDLEGEGNIVGVGLGAAGLLGGYASQAHSALGMTPGAEPGAPAVNVYVIEAMTAEQVRSVVVESLGVRAAADADVPINVIVTGHIDAQPHRFRIRPAPGGVSVGHYKVTAGTIGCLCVGRTAPRNSRLMILSNNHVLANSNNAVYGDCITQPGPIDGGKCPADQVAILERFVPINFSGGANYVDCATGWAWPDRVRVEEVYVSGGTRTFFRIGNAPANAAVGMIVGKTGRTTQLTRGQVTDINATIRVNYGGGRLALFVNQIGVRGIGGDFSAGGDSGSVIWTWDNFRRPVALLFAGGGGMTFGNPMPRVVAALDIQLRT
jgi:hypothetical protein